MYYPGNARQKTQTQKTAWDGNGICSSDKSKSRRGWKPKILTLNICNFQRQIAKANPITVSFCLTMTDLGPGSLRFLWFCSAVSVFLLNWLLIRWSWIRASATCLLHNLVKLYSSVNTGTEKPWVAAYNVLSISTSICLHTYRIFKSVSRWKSCVSICSRFLDNWDKSC